MPIDAIYGPFGEELRAALSKLADEEGETWVMEDGTIVLPEELTDFITGAGDVVFCCPADLFSFNKALKTEIIYNDSLRSRHGNTPQILVYYFNQDSEDSGLRLIPAVSETRITMIGSPPTKLIIDHGGSPLTGLIKLI